MAPQGCETAAIEREPCGSPSSEAWGVQASYRDAFKRRRTAPAESVEAILKAMGAQDREPAPAAPVTFLRPGSALVVDRPTEIRTEDGAVVDLAAGEAVPADLPLGYHTLTDLADGNRSTLVRSPGRCRLPEVRAWGWSVQLYATRSTRSWGMGDLADLRELGGRSAEELGAGLVMVNPLHAPRPGTPPVASPYSPSSRRFHNPLYLRVEEVAGADTLGGRLDELASQGRALAADRRIDRDAVFRLKDAALGELWAGFRGDAGFDRFCRQQGAALETYATFCALSEVHGGPWRTWPPGHRRPDHPDVAELRQAHRRRVDYHRWLQWLLDLQLADAAASAPLVSDLAVGFDPDGADAWEWQDVVAPGISVGAPADAFNSEGQDWGLPPFDPWRLRAAAYRPFVETLRSAFRHTAGLRIDHVMGLFRLFWVPHGTTAAAGAYVRYPAADLLDIVALESHRAGAYLIGEDLGTAEEAIHDELQARGVMSYKLLLFELIPPAEYPVESLAAVATHDLPTVAGVWTGGDHSALRKAGVPSDQDTMQRLRRRLSERAGVPDDASVDETISDTYAALARAPSLLLVASLEDALAVEDRPNVPGTSDEWPNWSLALPVPIDDLTRRPLARRIAGALRGPATSVCS